MSSTSARNCISTVTVPSPWHVSHRPPGILKEKCPDVNPRFLASGSDAKRPRRPSNGGLIHQHHFINKLIALQTLPCGRAPRRAVRLLILSLPQRLV